MTLPFHLIRLAISALFLATTTLPATAQDFVSFQSPSGNIHCVIYASTPAEARCDIIEYSPSFRAPPLGCDLDWGGAFIVEQKGAGLLGCVGDTAINPSSPVLNYGQNVQLGGFTCLSETTGMSCRNAGGGGFTISRASQRVF